MAAWIGIFTIENAAYDQMGEPSGKEGWRKSAKESRTGLGRGFGVCSRRIGLPMGAI